MPIQLPQAHLSIEEPVQRCLLTQRSLFMLFKAIQSYLVNQHGSQLWHEQRELIKFPGTRLLFSIRLFQMVVVAQCVLRIF